MGWVARGTSISTTCTLDPVFRIPGQNEPWEGAQTTLHALLEDDGPNHSGAGGAGVAALGERAHLRVALIAR